jgi:hypothetical protein
MQLLFDELLKKQNINPQAFQQAQPEKYAQWLLEFSELNENSFLQFKLFYINKIRRLYPLVHHK